MSHELDRAIHGLLCIGFAGTTVDDSLRRWLDRGVGGVIIFQHNAGPPDRVAALLDRIAEYAGEPIIRAVDQEGGRVARLRDGFTVPPPMAYLGTVADEPLAEAVGGLIGRELAAVGFNLALAPMLDLAINASSRVIGDRSLGSDPELVAVLGTALIRGIQSSGVMACAKHFPGHGDTPEDSHLTLPCLTASRDVILSRDLVPFINAIRAGVATVMPGHLVVQAYDTDRPATTSPVLLDELLRQRLGFGGLIVSDDLEMAAIIDTLGVERASVDALRAGVDLLLIGHDHKRERAEAVAGAIRAAVRRDELSEASLIEKYNRVLRAAADADKRIDRPGLDVVASKEHNAVIRQIKPSESLNPAARLVDPRAMGGSREQSRA